MRNLNQKCDIIEIIATKGEDGSPSHAESNRYTDLPCRINWTKSQDLSVGGRIVNARDAKVYTPYKSDISTEDLIYFNSQYYKIVGIKNPQERNHHLEIEIKLDTER